MVRWSKQVHTNQTRGCQSVSQLETVEDRTLGKGLSAPIQLPWQRRCSLRGELTQMAKGGGGPPADGGHNLPLPTGMSRISGEIVKGSSPSGKCEEITRSSNPARQRPSRILQKLSWRSSDFGTVVVRNPKTIGVRGERRGNTFIRMTPGA